MHQIRSIIQYLINGSSLRAISRELHLSRKAVTGYSNRLKACSIPLEQLRELGDAELSAVVYLPVKEVVPDSRKEDFLSRTEYFIRELSRTGVTRLLLWKEYKKQYPAGYEYAQFCALLAHYIQTHNPSMRLLHQPAEVMMVDFAGDKLSYTNTATGEVIPCPVLVCVLPYSNYAFVKALANARLLSLINALNECVQFFGGVPYGLKTDNMKQIVIKASRYEPSITEAFNLWARHYHISIITARVAHPRDKASVENEVKIAYRRIYAPLRNETFFSLEALNQAITHQLNIHNTENFQRKDYSRMDYFLKEEKPLLQPLPASPFIIKHRASAKVQRNYHITLGEDWHHYSVPYGYIGKTVSVVYDAEVVEIYLQMQRIALHKRSYKKHGYSTLKEHMPEGHQRYFEQRGWTGEYFLKQAAAIGDATRSYIEGVLKGKHFTEQTYNACLGILRLSKHYGTDRLEAACRRALAGGVFTFRTINNILKNNMDKHPFSEQQELFKTPTHNNIRGADHYK